MTPTVYFRSFLERAEDEGWISSYKWTVADDFKVLKEKVGPSDPMTGSRSHKRGFDGKWYCIDVQAHEGTQIGIDIEILADRPIFRKTQWLIERFHLEVSSDPQKVIQEWSKRESVYKALYPDNSNLTLQQLRRHSHAKYTAFIQGRDVALQTRVEFKEYWVMSLAWRTL